MTPFSPETELIANRFYLKVDQSMPYDCDIVLEYSKIVGLLHKCLQEKDSTKSITSPVEGGKFFPVSDHATIERHSPLALKYKPEIAIINREQSIPVLVV